VIFNRAPRFSPKVQFTILAVIQILQLIGCWIFIDSVLNPEEAVKWRFFAGTMLASLGAEPWGVMLALGLSRKNDT